MKEERSLRERILRKLPFSGFCYAAKDYNAVSVNKAGREYSGKEPGRVMVNLFGHMIYSTLAVVALVNFTIRGIVPDAWLYTDYRILGERERITEAAELAEKRDKEREREHYDELWNKLLSPGYADADSNGFLSTPEQLGLCRRMGNDLGSYIEGSGLKGSRIKVIITEDGRMVVNTNKGKSDYGPFMTYRKPTLAELTKADASYTAKRGSAGK